MTLIRKLLLVCVLALGLSGIAVADNAKVNINTADIEQLSSLQGIGDKKAAAIIRHRETYGYFNSVDQLSVIKGIGDKAIEKIRGQVVLDVPLNHELKKKGYK